MQRKAFLAILLIIVLGGACFANDGSWPKVKEFDDDFLAYSGTKSIDFIRPIFDVNGTIKYLFVCRGGTTEYTDPLSDRLGINYVSPLTCI